MDYLAQQFCPTVQGRIGCLLVVGVFSHFLKKLEHMARVIYDSRLLINDNTKGVQTSVLIPASRVIFCSSIHGCEGNARQC